MTCIKSPCRAVAISLTMAVLLPSGAFAQGGLLDQGRGLLGGGAATTKPGTTTGGAAGSLTNSQADSGLREALKVAS